MKQFIIPLILISFACTASAESAPRATKTTAVTSSSDKLNTLNADNIQLASVHAAILDTNSDTLLYAKNAEKSVPIASITKLMTAMVVIDSGRPLDELVTITKARQNSGKNAYSRIRINSKLSRGSLLRIALMSSENLSASVLAQDYPGGEFAFVKAMNDKANALGMKHSHFVDSAGLSPNNVSTASDLAKMVSAAANYKEIKEYSTTRNYVARFKNPRYKLGFGNTNPLVHKKSWDIALSKTGYLAEAGRCLVLLTEIDGFQVAMVLLDSFGKRSPIGDAGRVKRWITTGSGGSVAGAALKYERKKVNQLIQNDNPVQERSDQAT